MVEPDSLRRRTLCNPYRDQAKVRVIRRVALDVSQEERLRISIE
jgi:hypothetical protein